MVLPRCRRLSTDPSEFRDSLPNPPPLAPNLTRRPKYCTVRIGPSSLAAAPRTGRRTVPRGQIPLETLPQSGRLGGELGDVGSRATAVATRPARPLRCPPPAHARARVTTLQRLYVYARRCTTPRHKSSPTTTATAATAATAARTAAHTTTQCKTPAFRKQCELDQHPPSIRDYYRTVCKVSPSKTRISERPKGMSNYSSIQLGDER